jgi:hypothetical protein
MGCELVPLHEGGLIPRVPWRYQPKTCVVTLDRLEWWLSRGVTAWATPRNGVTEGALQSRSSWPWAQSSLSK